MSESTVSRMASSVAGFRGEIAAKWRPVELESAVTALADPGTAHETLHWGRNYLYAVRLETVSGNQDFVVKQFRNQTLRARLRRKLKGSKATRSWRAALALERAGVATASPAMLLESDRADGPSLFVTLRLRDVFEARFFFRALEAGEEESLYPDLKVATLLRTVGALLRRLHDAGIWHRDVSIGNLLVEKNRSDPTIYLIDLNRARLDCRMTVSRRTRDLCRLRIFERSHQEIFLRAYWGTESSGFGFKSFLYRVYFRGFLTKIEARRILRSPFAFVAGMFGKRHAHVHIPDAGDDSTKRDKVVWDRLSDQPHQHASRLQRLSVRLEDLRDHVGTAAVFASNLPRIQRRYRELRKDLHSKPQPWGEACIAVRPHGPDPSALLDRLDALGIRRVFLRLHPWASEHGPEEQLARALYDKGCDLVFGLPQSRELVKDSQRWKDAVAELAERFSPYGHRFQVGHAINRSKWGVWNRREYLDLIIAASEILRRDPEIEILGPAVIDYEFYVTASLLNLKEEGLCFDIVSSLLYVDRRGAPENRQLGFDTLDKVLQLKAIAETARNSSGRSWITEVNWPLWEGPHAPAGRNVAVDEETQASYLARYFLIALSSGMVERVYWWQLVARGYGLAYPEGDQLVTRPAFRALATLNRLLEGSTFMAPISSSPESYLYLFQLANGDELVAGWSRDGTGSGRLPRPAVEALSRDGEALPTPPGLEVTLGPAPKYYRLQSA